MSLCGMLSGRAGRGSAENPR